MQTLSLPSNEKDRFLKGPKKPGLPGLGPFPGWLAQGPVIVTLPLWPIAPSSGSWSPQGQGRWYSPRAPRVSGSLPPAPGVRTEGADSDGLGAWRLGAVPGAA